jgi:hypothetical protein
MGNYLSTKKTGDSVYETAISETDRSRLPARIAAVGAAILNIEEGVERLPVNVRPEKTPCGTSKDCRKSSLREK